MPCGAFWLCLRLDFWNFCTKNLHCTVLVELSDQDVSGVLVCIQLSIHNGHLIINAKDLVVIWKHDIVQCFHQELLYHQLWRLSTWTRSAVFTGLLSISLLSLPLGYFLLFNLLYIFNIIGSWTHNKIHIDTIQLAIQTPIVPLRHNNIRCMQLFIQPNSCLNSN